MANWIPFEDPAGGPNFYRFDDSADYYINVDNTGDGKPDVRYLFKFKTKVRNPNSFLYALPGVTVVRRPEAQHRPDLRRLHARTTRGGRLVHSNRIAHDVQVAPNNVGPKTIARATRASPTRRSSGSRGGGKVFAGQRDDPFFVDLGATFDAINLASAGPATPAAARTTSRATTTHAIVLQVPEREVTRDHQPVSAPDAANAVVGVWSSTERETLSVRRNGNGRGTATRAGLAARQPARQRGRHPARQEGPVQPHDPRQGRRSYGELRRRAGAGGDPERPVPGLDVPGDRPHGHRHGAADRRAGPDADRQGRAADRHAEAQPRRSRRRGEPGEARSALHRRRQRGLPERAPAGRRRRRHRAARRRRLPARARSCRSATAWTATTCRSSARSRTSRCRTTGFDSAPKRTEPPHDPTPADVTP